MGGQPRQDASLSTKQRKRGSLSSFGSASGSGSGSKNQQHHSPNHTNNGAGGSNGNSSSSGKPNNRRRNAAAFIKAKVHSALKKRAKEKVTFSTFIAQVRNCL